MERRQHNKLNHLRHHLNNQRPQPSGANTCSNRKGIPQQVSSQWNLKCKVIYSIIVNAEGEVQEINPIQFWESQRQSMPALAKLAMLVLSVPASSASVEQVVSHGGIIFRPHRQRMNDSSLSTLIYLKRNRLKMNKCNNNTSNTNTLRCLVEYCSAHCLD